jgi:zinc transport system substrate-binding protein
LINKVKEEKIPVVFHIELSNEKMADMICEATGAQKRLLHACHNISKDDFEKGETYLSLMTRNVGPLREALR